MTDIDNLSSKCDFFPLLCSLYNEREGVDVKEYFKNPFDVYKSELDRLSEHGDEGNYKICSLALCVLFDNQLNEKWFQGKATEEQRQIIYDTCEACEFNSIPKAKLKKALDTLDGTFICKQNGIYRTIHDKLFDFLAHYFGQKMIECLIDHGDSGLVHERFIWQTIQDDRNSDIDYIIEIPDDYLESYLERFIKDWLEGNVIDVFSNNNMKVSSFREELLQHLQQLDKSQQVALASTKDTVVPKESCASGNTPLVHTCYDGYTDMVQWMLHNDVDVDQCRDDGVTGLYMASQEGHTDIVKLLLEKDPNVDLCNNGGWSPLNTASIKGHTEIVKLLLEKDANVDLCNKDGWSPLKTASNKGHTDIVKLLLEKDANVDLCSKDGLSPLNTASIKGHTEIVKLLLEKDANVDLCNKDGWSPLNTASKRGDTNIVKLLLEKDPNVDLCDKDGWSPLNTASNEGHTDIVKLLLERNPNIDLGSNAFGFTPLIDACSRNYISIIQLLLKHKPDINAQTDDGGNALYFSALYGNLEITRLLLENNADFNICMHSKQSIADTYSNHPRLTLDEERQSWFDFLLEKASSNVRDYISDKTVGYGFDVVVSSSPLHIACFMGRTDVVHCLLNYHVNINITKEDGATPLFYACEVGHEDIVRLLLAKEADTQICRVDGTSPLNIATDNGRASIVKMLTEHIKKEDTLSS
ncbi:ankyrin-1-like [Mytilus edulis]|uniref:ankyrin-1-like n=1 Tax=Mytilus edulis TaxID=6550 RepID=UPI0039EEE5CD